MSTIFAGSTKGMTTRFLDKDGDDPSLARYGYIYKTSPTGGESVYVWMNGCVR